jgi:hypothetical protein
LGEEEVGESKRRRQAVEMTLEAFDGILGGMLYDIRLKALRMVVKGPHHVCSRIDLCRWVPQRPRMPQQSKQFFALQLHSTLMDTLAFSFMKIARRDSIPYRMHLEHP